MHKQHLILVNTPTGRLSMTQQLINIGNTANDGTGTPLRSSFEICNENFTELYNIGGATGIQNGNSNISIVQDSTINLSSTGVANVLIVSGTGATLQGQFTGTLVSATGNVVAGGLFIGNGSALTGVISSPAASLLTGTTLSSNVITSSLTTVGTLGSLIVTANVNGGNIISSAAISASGNVIAQNLNSVGIVSATGNVAGGNINTAGIVNVAGNVDSTGNISGTYFVGNGSLLTGIQATTAAAAITGTTLSANVTASFLQSVGNLNSLVVSNALGGSGNVSSNNISAASTISAVGNITGGNLISLGLVTGVIFTATGDITGQNITANLTNGNVAANNIIAISRVEGTIISASGNIIGANVSTPGLLTVTGNITGGNLSGTSIVGTLTTPSQTNITAIGVLSALSATGNITGGNINTVAQVSASGNINGGNINTGGLISSTGNVIGGNINTAGLITATGNVTGGNIATGGILSVGGDAIVTGNLTVSGDTQYTNVTTLAIEDPIISIGRGANNAPLTTNDSKDRGTQLYYYNTAERNAFMGYDENVGKMLLATNVSVSSDVVTVIQYGNTLVGDLEASANVSATGNVVGGNITSPGGANVNTLLVRSSSGSAASVVGNIVGGNITTGGVLSATGNITGGNVNAGANVFATTHTGTTVSVTGNVTGGNITTAGVVTSTGNIIGGNIVTGGAVSATGAVSGGSIATGGAASATGNVTGGNVTTAGLASVASLSVTGNVATVTSANYTIGYRDIPQLTSLGTLALTDGGKHYYGTGTITIPTNASVPFTIGTTILIIASGAVTVSAGSVTLTQVGTGSGGSRTIAQYGMATLIKVASDTWYISGTGIS
jgi:hypothetical protein